MTDDHVRRALADAHRDEWGFVLAATVRVARDLDLAEECVQDAYADALRRWPADGIPTRPGAWLTTAARRRAVDAIRRESTLRAKLPLLLDDAPDEIMHPSDDADVPDERLRLMLLCCHPAIAAEARTALALRFVCGVSTADIAHGFLVSEPTMAARLTRAKRKISGAGIPYRMPTVDELPARIALVLDTVYLVATAGHTAPIGDALTRSELADEAERLAAMLHRLVPGDPEVAGLLALTIALTARRPSRVGDDGELMTLADQDRSRWDRDALDRARALVLTALPHPGAGRFALQAAIAVLHTDETVDWPQIVGLYDRLLEVWPSPVVALNRIVAVSRAIGPVRALDELAALELDERLGRYHYLPAVRGDLLARAGRRAEASASFLLAADLTENAVEERMLRERAAALSG